MQFTDAVSPPSISWPSASETITYLIVNLDLDPPFVSFPFLGPALHWIQPGVKASPEKVLTSSDPFVADYAGPGPPPGSGPHRYCFLLYEQPAGFDGNKWAPPNGQSFPISKRIRYDLGAWEKEAGLGNPLAVGWFKSNVSGSFPDVFVCEGDRETFDVFETCISRLILISYLIVSTCLLPAF
jgi:hypothetical protein